MNSGFNIKLKTFILLRILEINSFIFEQIPLKNILSHFVGMRLNIDFA